MTTMYTGSEELEVMQLATNYNRDLIEFVSHELPQGAREIVRVIGRI